MSNTISGNSNVPDKFAYASQDKNTDEKVVYTESKSSIESDSVFTATKDIKTQNNIILDNTTNQFSNVNNETVAKTVAKYLNGTSLAQILESKMTTMFDTIQYQKATVVSNESVSGYQEEGDEGTDASGEKISKHTTGYSQALTQEVAKKISAQVSEIADGGWNH